MGHDVIYGSRLGPGVAGDLLKTGSFDAARAWLIAMQAADGAEGIDDLPDIFQTVAFRLLAKDGAIEV